MRRKAHRKTVRRRRHRGGAFPSMKGMTAKISNPFKKTATAATNAAVNSKATESTNNAVVSEPNPNDFKQNTSKTGFFSRLRSKSPFSKKSGINGEIEPKLEPESIKNSVSNVNLSEGAPVLAAAAGVNTVRNNIKANAEKAAAEREAQGARPVALPNNNAVNASEGKAENGESVSNNNKNEKQKAEPVAAANNHKKACSCEECNAIKEAKKNCSAVRKFLRLCNNSEVQNDKKKPTKTNAPPAQNGNETKATSVQNGNITNVPSSGQVQVQVQIPPATAQDVAGLLTWLQPQLQQNPIGISRIIGQLAVILGNPSQMESWKMFVERLKGIQADPNPQSQQVKLVQLGNETWGPVAPRPLTSIKPGSPPPSAPPEQAGGRRRARRHTRKMKRRM